jgi:hypothetical protein
VVGFAVADEIKCFHEKWPAVLPRAG